MVFTNALSDYLFTTTVYRSKEETFNVISVWREDSIQTQLEGCKRNREVYSKISCKLSLAAAYSHIHEQCQEKIKKLKAEYKKLGGKQGRKGIQNGNIMTP